MILQHNMAALNALRHNGINNSQTSGNLEKLSSGYRINRAADDAAGLAISEKMRSQIRGLGMAEQNTENAVSLIQTAEGGLNEVHAILHRMRELAVQASNGTYVNEDREQIELELQALKSEINRIASSTHFNGINLLDGTLDGYSADAIPGNVAAGATLTGTDYYPGSYPAIVEYLKDFGFSGEIGDSSGSNGATIAGDAAFNIYDASLDGKSANLIITSGTETGGDARVSLQIGDKVYTATIAGAGQYPSYTVPTPILEDTYVFTDSSGAVIATLAHSDPNSTKCDLLANNAQSGVINNITLNDPESILYFSNTGGSGAIMPSDRDGALTNSTFAVAGGQLIFQIGANGTADQQVGLDIPLMSTINLGTLVPTANNPSGSIADISVLTRELANSALTMIDAAVTQVSSVRANLGALQNRLEHTLNNLGVTKENLTAAESTIRDVDMAKEMMEFTKNSILVQASQAMLAQANSLPQGVLSLLS